MSAPRSTRDRGDAVVGGRTGQESRSTGQPAAASMTDSTILQTFNMTDSTILQTFKE
jgi:hypothetical protein